MKKIEAILLDMDGTLIDSEAHYIKGTYTWLKRLGFKGQIADIYPIIGLTMDETYDYLQSLVAYPKAYLAKLNDDYFFSEDPLDYPSLLFPEVREALKELKKEGYRLALCTSSGRKEIDLFFKKTNLGGYFDLVLTKEDISHNKPDPEIYLKALKKLNIHKEKAVVVEDSKQGILASKRAGIYTLARKDKRFGIDQSDSDAVIEDLNDLLKWLRSNNDGRCD